MAATPTPIDISNMPDLVRLTKKIEITRAPLALKRENKVVAVITPVEEASGTHPNRKAIEETLALAGAWSDLDWDDMIHELDRIRHESKPTPPVDLDL